MSNLNSKVVADKVVVDKTEMGNPVVSPVTVVPAGPVNPDMSRLARVAFKSPTADSQPCNWEISSTGETTVYCKNTVSGSTFEGTIAEFSAALKGL